MNNPFGYYIPKKVIMISSNPVRVKLDIWVKGSPNQEEEITEDLYVPATDPNIFIVKPTKVVDATNKPSVTSGIRWATKLNNMSFVEKKEVQNSPVTGIKMIGFDVANSTKKTTEFKALFPDGSWVDMEAESLLDIVSTGSIQPEGLLAGEYIWAKIGNGMSLVRVGSSLHQVTLAGTLRKRMKKIKTKDLEVGGIYTTKAGQRWLYAGFCDTYSIPYGSNILNKNTGGQAWFAINSAKFHPQQLVNSPYGWQFHSSSPFIVELVDKTTIPSNLFRCLREKGSQLFDENLSSKRSFLLSSINQHDLYNNTYINASLCTVTSQGEPLVLFGEVKKKFEYMGWVAGS